jgi:glucose/arabinose dehydrogenase
MKAKALFPSIVLLLSLQITGCANNKGPNTPAGDADTSKNPVETAKPNANYKPAFSGQTRIAGVTTKTAYNAEKIAGGLGKPWAVVPMPDGRLLITEKTGHMMIYDANGAFVKKITGFPAVDSRGQGGLLDVAMDPAFESNKMIYWSYSEKQGSGNLMAVAKGKLNEQSGTVENPVVIFRATPALNSTLHYGSRIVFDKDGHLFVSTGERSILEGRAQAQLLSSGLGKIFKITKDGQPAPGNPFINQSGAIPQIYAYGIRNAQGLELHPVTGELWENEFGPRGGDEVNIIKKGKNYGWPTITYGLEYSGQAIGGPIQQQSGMEQPVYYWDPVLSPSGMAFYRGKAIPEWENNLFIGGLSSSHICRLVIVNNKVTGEERLMADLNERFRDIGYANGKLYTVTDRGNLYRISKK